MGTTIHFIEDMVMTTRRKAMHTKAALLCVVLLAALTQTIPVAFGGGQVPMYAAEEILVDPEPPLAGARRREPPCGESSDRRAHRWRSADGLADSPLAQSRRRVPTCATPST